jgi:hypothetical protein
VEGLTSLGGGHHRVGVHYSPYCGEGVFYEVRVHQTGRGILPLAKRGGYSPESSSRTRKRATLMLTLSQTGKRSRIS